MRGRRSEGAERYMRGFFAAVEKGRAAAEDPAFTESHNPYRRFEHHRNWRDGFRERRAEISAHQTTAQPS